jgi:hypothetical protein
VALARRIAVAVGIALSGVLIGAAASLGLSSTTLGAATTSAPRCTAAALSVIQNLSAGTVVSVTVGNLPAGCGGATLQVTVNNGIANGSGSATVAAGGGSLTVTLGSAPAVRVADEIDIVLVGP